jgi:hypothetical protein
MAAQSHHQTSIVKLDDEIESSRLRRLELKQQNEGALRADNSVSSRRKIPEA